MHWHAHAASSLTFTNEGSYLLSGGEEAVLVVWQHSTGNKRFLPRLGAPVCGIITDRRDLFYAIATKDNAVRVVDVQSYDTTCVVQGLKMGPKGAAICGRAGLRIDPFSGLVRYDIHYTFSVSLLLSSLFHVPCAAVFILVITGPCRW